MCQAFTVRILRPIVDIARNEAASFRAMESGGMTSNKRNFCPQGLEVEVIGAPIANLDLAAELPSSIFCTAQAITLAT